MPKTYQQIINSIISTKTALKENMGTEILLPQEIQMIEGLGLIPKESIPYFNRWQMLELLTKFEIGITLEWKFKTAK